MSPRAAGATQHELSRIGLLASLPGETLARLAQRMTREDVPAGTPVVTEAEPRRAERPAPGRLLRRGRARDANAAHRVRARAHTGNGGEL